MVKQYPYTIQIKAAAGNSTQNAFGDWVKPGGDPPAPVQIPCRTETRSSVGYVQTTDGKMTEFQCIVYMPLPVADVQVDTSVTVLNGNTPLINGIVKHFSRGQLNARIWL